MLPRRHAHQPSAPVHGPQDVLHHRQHRHAQQRPVLRGSFRAEPDVHRVLHLRVVPGDGVEQVLDPAGERMGEVVLERTRDFLGCGAQQVSPMRQCADPGKARPAVLGGDGIEEGLHAGDEGLGLVLGQELLDRGDRAVGFHHVTVRGDDVLGHEGPEDLANGETDVPTEHLAHVGQAHRRNVRLPLLPLTAGARLAEIVPLADGSGLGEAFRDAAADGTAGVELADKHHPEHHQRREETTRVPPDDSLKFIVGSILFRPLQRKGGAGFDGADGGGGPGGRAGRG